MATRQRMLRTMAMPVEDSGGSTSSRSRIVSAMFWKWKLIWTDQSTITTWKNKEEKSMLKHKDILMLMWFHWDSKRNESDR